MLQLPKISICLCCYNDELYLQLFLKSLFETTYIPFEVCIVDNGSTDGSSKIIQEWIQNRNNVLCLAQPENEGVKAVNKAVEMSRGDYVVDCNADMVWSPGWDAAMLYAIRKLERTNPKGRASVSATLCEPNTGNPEYYQQDFGKTPEEFNMEAFWEWKARVTPKHDMRQIHHPIMMRRSLWDYIGGIDPVYPHPGMGSDVDLGCELLSYGATCVMIGNAIIYHFSSATLRRMRAEGIDTPPGEKEFENKWGFSQKEMYEQFHLRERFDWKEC